MDSKIRSLTIKDLEGLMEKYIAHYNAEGDQWTQASARARLEQIFLTPGFYGLGLFQQEKLLGFALGFFKQYDDLKLYYLEELLIFKAYQRQGLGTSLMKEVEARAREQGAAKLALATTHEDCHQRFYGGLGYQPSDFLIYMNKELN